jgi:hypothetical protein
MAEHFMPNQFVRAAVYSQLCHKSESVSATASDPKNLLKTSHRQKFALAFVRRARYKEIVHWAAAQ